MTQIILPLAIGLVLLGMAVYWLLWTEAPHEMALPEARDALASLQSKFLPMSLVERILDYDDFVFVRSQKEREILRLLETERKTIAIYWLRHTRRQVRLLMTFHVKSARGSAGLSAALELKLAVSYLIFLAARNALLALIWLRGPFRAQKVAQHTLTVATRFCSVSESVLTLAEAHCAKMSKTSGQQSPAR